VKGGRAIPARRMNKRAKMKKENGVARGAEIAVMEEGKMG
jgi:hypothetical protein